MSHTTYNFSIIEYTQMKFIRLYLIFLTQIYSTAFKPTNSQNV
jgi:hypothetical protein